MSEKDVADAATQREKLVNYINSTLSTPAKMGMFKRICDLSKAMKDNADNVDALRDDALHFAKMHICSGCREVSDSELHACATCKAVCYCNRKCQRKAWSNHKTICGEDCAICLSPLACPVFDRNDDGLYFSRSVLLMPCKHQFHKPCMDAWLCTANGMFKVQCPLCRDVPRTYFVAVVPVIKQHADRRLCLLLREQFGDKAELILHNGCKHPGDCHCDGPFYDQRVVRIDSKHQDAAVAALASCGFTRKFEGFMFLRRSSKERGGVCFERIPSEVLDKNVTTYAPETLRCYKGGVMWPDVNNCVCSDAPCVKRVCKVKP